MRITIGQGKRSRRAAGGAGRRALTLIESMLAVVTLSIVATGTAVGLRSVSHVPGNVEEQLWQSDQLTSTLENLHDTAYASLLSGSRQSDPDYQGNTHTITWTVVEIDPSTPTLYPPTSKANSGLKQVTATIEGQSLTTWVSR